MSQSRPLTILFADVSGSTRLFETRGDVEARRLIASVLDALSGICRQYGGHVVKTIGDEIMCTLPGPLDGLLAACLQHEIDHLDGVLFVDHISALKRNMLLRKLAKELKLKAQGGNRE